MKPFRNKHPQRSYTGTPKTDYKEYRPELRNDFGGRCAYTDCSDEWWADGLHIDHFAPWRPRVDSSKKAAFENLKHNYNNLVYACPQVNRAKGNDWPSDNPEVAVVDDKGYLDPCNNDLNEYFERTDSGGILAKNHPVARYMWRRLKLYSRRYEVYWRIEQIRDRLRRMKELQAKDLPAPLRQEILEGKSELTDELTAYLDYLRTNHSYLR